MLLSQWYQGCKENTKEHPTSGHTGKLHIFVLQRQCGGRPSKCTNLFWRKNSGGHFWRKNAFPFDILVESMF